MNFDMVVKIGYLENGIEFQTLDRDFVKEQGNL